jgi:hypothetical protein
MWPTAGHFAGSFSLPILTASEARWIAATLAGYPV